jgi:hypothetical protein
MPILRQFRESPLEQGEDERIAYAFDTTKWGVTCPLSPSMRVLDASGLNITSSVTTGSPVVSSCTATCIVLARFDNPVPGSTYRVEAGFQDNQAAPNQLWAYAVVNGAS